MAPPPPPSINLLKALRALIVIRPVVPTLARRKLSYKSFTTTSAASAHQHPFHRRFHAPQVISTFYQQQILARKHLQDGDSRQLSRQSKAAAPLPILPSPHLLARRFHASPSSHSATSQTPNKDLANASSAPSNLERGPVSDEITQTNFDTMDMFSSIPPPASSVDACLSAGFHLSNGVKIENAGVLIVSGEAFTWKPWGKIGRNLLNARGAWDSGGDAAWGLLQLVWPKPDLLILGVGPKMVPLAEATRNYLNGLGIRVEVQDTSNAAAQFNMLATERGVGSVAAALVPVGWKEGVGF